jgi:hypothetical protein
MYFCSYLGGLLGWSIFIRSLSDMCRYYLTLTIFYKEETWIEITYYSCLLCYKRVIMGFPNLIHKGTVKSEDSGEVGLREQQ